MKKHFIYIIFFGLSCFIKNIYAQDTTITKQIDTLQTDTSLTIQQPVKIDSINTINEALNAKLPKEYKVAGVNIVGCKYVNHDLLLSIANLKIGNTVTLPNGDQLSKAIQNMWRQKLFEEVDISIVKIIERSVFLEIKVKEIPRLKKVVFKGITKSQTEELIAKINTYYNKIYTQQTKKNIDRIIRTFFAEKGFLQLEITYEQQKNDQNNTLTITAWIEKNRKNKINEVVFFGNTQIDAMSLRSAMEDTKTLPRFSLYNQKNDFVFGTLELPSTKKYFSDFNFLSPSATLRFLNPYLRLNLFSGAKFDRNKYITDKDKIIEAYHTKGYRDAQILQDTIYIKPENNRINIEMKIAEGNRYYFGNIKFKGNSKYADSFLLSLLNIQKGEVYDIDRLNKKLGKKLTAESMGEDISSLYLDDGYLFFRADPIETRIYNDTIDFEIRFVEGPQATIRNINIAGNEKTKTHVIRREIRTLPGEKFSRADLIRSQRELATLNFFNPEKIGINPVPNMEDGTVDINYSVEEKSSDQVEMSVGYAGIIGVTGTVGLTFNNFSIQNIFKKSGWKPIPSGDGQKLSLRAQTTGRTFFTTSASFTEPWLGGKKRKSLSISTNYSFMGNTFDATTGTYAFDNVDKSNLQVLSFNIGLGKQVKWPDDFFTLGFTAGTTLYFLKNYNIFPNISNGTATNLFLRATLSRNSIDQPVFPRTGSNFTLIGQFTPPYSLFREGTSNPYSWVEYHKYKFTSEWYVPLTRGLGVDKNRQLVLKLAAKYGIVARYNDNMDFSPFERFQVGDAGLMNTMNFLGYDIIAQRGYFVYDNSDPKINPQKQGTNNFFTIFNKYQAELRYPISLNPSATIFATTYFEAANGWFSLKDYNPMQLRRSVGVGVRFYLPIFGLLGFDYALGIDRLNNYNSFNDASRFNFIIGFEPE